MSQAYINGEDLHRGMAARIFRIPPEEVDKVKRKRAKLVNFGYVYGAQPQRAMDSINQVASDESERISLEEAAELRKIFFETYPELLFTDKFSKYMNEYIDKVYNSYVSIHKIKHLFKFIYSPDLLLKYTFISHKDYLDLILKFEN
jgi:DNA polymerase I-like protein with 3'-5' exonuclease and polymerase domains